MKIVSSPSYCGLAVLAAITILAPSAANFFAIAKPIPRLPPVMKTVISLKYLSKSFQKVIPAFVEQRRNLWEKITFLLLTNLPSVIHILKKIQIFSIYILNVIFRFLSIRLDVRPRDL